MAKNKKKKGIDGGYNLSGDIRPSGKVLLQKGGTKNVGVDNNTRSIVDAPIGIKPGGGLGGGSGSPKSTLKSNIARLNKKVGK